MSTALSSRRPKEGAERPPATAPGENWRDPLGESFAEAEPRGNSAGTQESLEFSAIYGMIFPFKDPCMDDFPIIWMDPFLTYPFLTISWSLMFYCMSSSLYRYSDLIPIHVFSRSSCLDLRVHGLHPKVLRPEATDQWWRDASCGS
jgi:hypothetical protein